MDIPALQSQPKTSVMPFEQMAGELAHSRQGQSARRRAGNSRRFLLRQILGEARKTVVPFLDERGFQHDRRDLQRHDQQPKWPTASASPARLVLAKKPLQTQLVHQVLASNVERRFRFHIDFRQPRDDRDLTAGSNSRCLGKTNKNFNSITDSMIDRIVTLINALREELGEYGEMLALLDRQQQQVIARAADEVFQSIGMIKAQGMAIQHARTRRRCNAANKWRRSCQPKKRRGIFADVIPVAARRITSRW